MGHRQRALGALFGFFGAVSLAPVQADAVVSSSFAEIVHRCAPKVNATTMTYLVHFESRGNQFAVHVNHGFRLPRQPVTLAEARSTVSWLYAKGYNFDVGLLQVNSANFKNMGLTPTDLLDPCTNVRSGAKVLVDCYTLAASRYGAGQDGLKHALSCYNTGSLTAGLSNGYVDGLLTLARADNGPTELMVPALLPGGDKAPAGQDDTPAAEEPAPGQETAPPTPPARHEPGEEDAFGDGGQGEPDGFAGKGESSLNDRPFRQRVVGQRGHSDAEHDGKPYPAKTFNGSVGG